MNVGNSVTLPLLTREGYTFDGWYDSAVGGTLMGTAGSEYCPDGNITLYGSLDKASLVFEDSRRTAVAVEYRNNKERFLLISGITYEQRLKYQLKTGI